MKTITRRLTRGMDLKKEIERLVSGEGIEAGVILSGVGCVSAGRFRLADGVSIKEMTEPLEILSLNGTIGQGGLHLHISYGDCEGRAWGGHLTEGNLVNTTCELVVGVLSGERFTRQPDENTGYSELVVEDIK